MEKTRQYFDKAAASWDQLERRGRLAEEIVRAIRSRITLTPEMDVLDFGCGTGLLTLRLRPLVRSVTGVDSSPGMLAVLESKIAEQKMAGIVTRCQDVDQGDALEGQFHLVTSSMTLHHVGKISNLLKQLHGVVAPGGYLAVADLDLEGGLFHEDHSGVAHDGFDRGAMSQSLAEAGFSEIQIDTAATVTKTASDGKERQFTIFLATGRKAG